MRSVVDGFREQEGWRRESCCMCNGTGMTSDYGCGDEPKECTSCAGSGVYWISPKGRHVEFPGRRLV